MADSAVTKICGTCLLVSGLLGLVAAPIAIGAGYPPVVNFGDGEILKRFAAAPAPLLFGVMQLSLPTLALASPLGFWYLLRNLGSIVVLGVVLNSLGLVFTTIQDGIELALLLYLPPAYVAANDAIRPALLAIGGFGEMAMAVFGRLGIVGYIGLLFINWAMWKIGRKWIAVLYFVSFVLIGLAANLATVVPALGIGFPIGFLVLRLWMICAAVIMLRWAPERSGASEQTPVTVV